MLPRLLTFGQHAGLMIGLASALGISVETLPPVFAGLSPKPLMRGIHEAFIARYPGVDREALGTWLASWTSTPAYLHRLAHGGPRFDLDGAVSGEVTPADKGYAKWRLRQLRLRE